MKNLDIKQPGEKGKLKTDVLASLGMSLKAEIEHEKYENHVGVLS